ncbi:MAG: MFS transporter, partial [Dysgonamonadaceae bacterium]|nr:MFS transporter [Dysgonamonadaceae bacterium]
MKTASNRTIISLCTMLFLQYMLVAVWWIPYAAYLTRHEIPDATKAIALSAMAVGFMTSSIVGAIADRYLPAQKVLAATNLAVSLLLLAAGLSSSPTLTIILIYIIMLLYMPTWALTGSITLKHVSQQQFPRIRLFGTLGWVSSGLFSIIALNIFQNTTFDSSSLTYLCGSAVALLAALHALTIPHTPPTATKQKLTLARILGFEALTLFRDRNCLAWFLLTFAAVLGYAMYYTYIGWFFNDRGFHLITATVSLGQLG